MLSPHFLCCTTYIICAALPVTHKFGNIGSHSLQANGPDTMSQSLSANWSLYSPRSPPAWFMSIKSIWFWSTKANSEFILYMITPLLVQIEYFHILNALFLCYLWSNISQTNSYYIQMIQHNALSPLLPCLLQMFLLYCPLSNKAEMPKKCWQKHTSVPGFSL